MKARVPLEGLWLDCFEKLGKKKYTRRLAGIKKKYAISSGIFYGNS